MARRAIYLMEEVYFHPMNSRRPLEYLTWLTGYKREDEQRKRGGGGAHLGAVRPLK